MTSKKEMDEFFQKEIMSPRFSFTPGARSFIDEKMLKNYISSKKRQY